MENMNYKNKYIKYKRKYLNSKMNNNNFRLSVREPWLSYIKNGLKRVEGRKGTYHKFAKWIGKKVIFYNSSQEIPVKVINVRHYNTLYDYLDAEGFSNVLPGVKSYQDAVNIYHKFYSDEDIKNAGGMCGIVIEVIK